MELQQKPKDWYKLDDSEKGEVIDYFQSQGILDIPTMRKTYNEAVGYLDPLDDPDAILSPKDTGGEDIYKVDFNSVDEIFENFENKVYIEENDV